MDLQSDTSQVHPLNTMVGSLYAAMYLTIRELSGSLASTQQVILLRKAATTLPAWEIATMVRASSPALPVTIRLITSFPCSLLCYLGRRRIIFQWNVDIDSKQRASTIVSAITTVA